MMRRFIRAMAVVALAGLVWSNSAADAQAQGDLPSCSSYPGGQASYSCSCPPMSEAYGFVWGTDVFTLDSDVCMAALHAGAIGIGGGAVTASALPGQASYVGTMSNGVPSRDWGSYDASFMFETPEPAPVKYGSNDACFGFPESLDMLTCSCTPQATAKGTFWGNDPYTIDSDICIAARHSGIIGPEGGTVTAIRTIGLQSYTSSLNNGVEGNPSGPFDGSMVFDRN